MIIFVDLIAFWNVLLQSKVPKIQLKLLQQEVKGTI